MNGGQDVGILLAKTLPANNALETLSLDHMDLTGSRNVNEWANALGEITSLNALSCMGMSECIKAVDKLILDHNSMIMGLITKVGIRKSTVDAHSTVQHPDDKRQTFLYATMRKEDVQKFKEATHAEDVVGRKGALLFLCSLLLLFELLFASPTISLYPLISSCELLHVICHDFLWSFTSSFILFRCFLLHLSLLMLRLSHTMHSCTNLFLYFFLFCLIAFSCRNLFLVACEPFSLRGRDLIPSPC